MLRIHQAALAALMVAAFATSSRAQDVTQAEIQRLQDNIYQATTDVSQLRSRDASRASALQTELDDLRDEVIYLKVKLRKERSLSRAEYTDVRVRIDDVRTRARDDRPTASAPPPATQPQPAARGTAAGTTAAGTTANNRGALEIPAGTEMDVRLSGNLNSGTAQVEDRFEGTTLADVTVNGRAAIPAGSVVRGVVSSVEPGTRTNRTAKMTVSFDQVTVNGRDYPLRATVTQAIEGEGIKGETARIGTGAGVGAIIGGILGGFKGALAGILIGGGGTIAATEGKEVELPQGTVLRVRIDSPVQISNAR